jgi:hypothetical protein
MIGLAGEIDLEVEVSRGGSLCLPRGTSGDFATLGKTALLARKYRVREREANQMYW